jgi:hypothetical protein
MKSVSSPDGDPVTMLLAVLWMETMSLRMILVFLASKRLSTGFVDVL